MGQIKTNAIVLSRTDYRDNDRMLTLFSQDRGLLSAVARRCKQPKSPLLAASEVFCSGEYVLYQSREHMSVTSCEVTDSFYPLREDYDRLLMGMQMLELCRHVVQPEQENARLFSFLVHSLAHLAYGETPGEDVLGVFFMGILSLSGFRPQVKRCAACRGPLSQAGVTFSVRDGGLHGAECRQAGDREIGQEDVLFLQTVMQEGLEALGKVHISPALLGALRDMTKDRLEAELTSARL